MGFPGRNSHLNEELAQAPAATNARLWEKVNTTQTKTALVGKSRILKGLLTLAVVTN
jgi:hypothetical protein